MWTESHSAVPVSGGFFTVKLGSIEPLITPVDFSKQLYLGIQVGADPEMSPRLKLEDVPHALGSKDNFNIIGNAYIMGAVGIGTTTPAPEASLHVAGPGVLRTDYGLTVWNTGGWSPIRLRTAYGGDERYWDLFTAHGGYGGENLVLRYANSDMVVFQAYQGLVGIGTISPQAKLHVKAELPEFTALKIGDYAAGDRQYLQIDVENSDPPNNPSCDDDSDVGRMIVRGDTRQLFICMPVPTGSTSWKSVTLN